MYGVGVSAWVDCVIVKASNLSGLGRGILIYFEVSLHSSMHHQRGQQQIAVRLLPEIDSLQWLLQAVAM